MNDITARTPAFAAAAEEPSLSPIDDFVGARDAALPTDRLKEVRHCALDLRERLLDGAKVRFFRSFKLVRVPYPTKYAFRDAFSLPTPYLHIVNRLFVAQFDTAAGVKTLLVSPSDLDGNAETPFFARIRDALPRPLRKAGTQVLAPIIATVEECLAQIGLSPADVDYITYDHLHTQDLRKWLGTVEQPGYFPNAKLLVMRQEWMSARGLLPTQRDWYCPGGTDGIDPSRVVLLDGDTLLGESVALIHTPGHTEGNHSIVVHTDEGLFVTSENGVGPDSYAPQHSRIPGLAKYARTLGAEVVLNGNTLEGSVDQYISMIAEKTLAGPSQRHPDFPNVLCSSEFEAYWAFPGVAPTFGVGDVRFGELVGATKG